MEYKRDRTIENIKKEDAAKVAEIKAKRQNLTGGGLFGKS